MSKTPKQKRNKLRKFQKIQIEKSKLRIVHTKQIEKKYIEKMFKSPNGKQINEARWQR